MRNMKTIERNTRTRLLATIAFAGLLATGCGELAQDGPKPFVKDGTYGAVAQADARTRDKGLAERASFQDEYVLLEETSKVALIGSSQ